MQNANSEREDALRRITACGLMPIVRGAYSPQEILSLAEIIADCGISVLEVTMNSSHALEAIAVLRQAFEGRLLIGAGTVRNRQQLEEARSAGAQFTVAPNLDEPTVTAAAKEGFLHLPGVFTPTEIERASSLGCSVVKLFPIDCLGPKYLRAVRAPLDHVQFLPTGGVTPENTAEYVAAGAVAVGIGSALLSGPGQDTNEVATRAAAFRTAWDDAAAAKAIKR